MEYNVFDTEHEAVYEAYDFNAWKESISPSIVNDNYWNLTNKWSDVKQRITDGKWVYNLCLKDYKLILKKLTMILGFLRVE